MPIIHLRGLADVPVGQDPKALTRVATSVAEVLDCPLDSVWCTFTSVDTMTIGGREAGQSDAILYLDLLMRERGTQVGQEALQTAAEAAASEYSIDPKDVWARLIELTPGTVWAGGQLI